MSSSIVRCEAGQAGQRASVAEQTWLEVRHRRSVSGTTVHLAKQIGSFLGNMAEGSHAGSSRTSACTITRTDTTFFGGGLSDQRCMIAEDFAH
jgi:hypothetical protein